MIAADLVNAAEQIPHSKKIQIALDFLTHTDLNILEVGRVEISGPDLYGIVQSYQTKTKENMVHLEGHRKFIDIHYLIRGEETLCWASSKNMPVTENYDEEKDIWYGRQPVDQVSEIKLTAGQLVVFYPEDLHTPQLLQGKQSSQVKKIVIKVAV
jgi:YhcH/YjgK/YiaL family protein